MLYFVFSVFFVSFFPMYMYKCICIPLTWAAPEGGGGQGVRTPLLKNHKNIGFLSNTGPDPLKKSQSTKPAFNFGPLLACQLNAI